RLRTPRGLTASRLTWAAAHVCGAALSKERRMSQRPSGYQRQPDEAYETPAWVVTALLTQLNTPIRCAWDPCDRHSGRLVAALRAQRVDAVGSTADFLTTTAPPPGVSDLITNPPYGADRRGELAVRFIEHALELPVPRIAML